MHVNERAVSHSSLNLVDLVRDESAPDLGQEIMMGYT